MKVTFHCYCQFELYIAAAYLRFHHVYSNGHRNDSREVNRIADKSAKLAQEAAEQKCAEDRKVFDSALVLMQMKRSWYGRA
jgi:hypothetical protein